MFKAMMIWLVLFFGAGAAYAENEVSGEAETIALARDYLEAYQALDLGRLETYYADQVRFNDPTSLRVQGVWEPFIWHGRVEMMNGLRGWSAYIDRGDGHHLCWNGGGRRRQRTNYLDAGRANRIHLALARKVRAVSPTISLKVLEK